MRGLKGLWWEPEQYLGWPAFLERAGYDFLMLCYTFCPETGLSWRQPLREPEREIVRRLADDCVARGITLCLALHPLIGGQAWAPEQAAVRFHPTSGQGWFLRYWQSRRPNEALRPDPPIRYGSDEDLGLLVAKCREAQELGVGAIALCLDDIDPGSTPDGFSDLAAAHVWLVTGWRQPAPPLPGSGGAAGAHASALAGGADLLLDGWCPGPRRVYGRSRAGAAARCRCLLDRRRRARPRHHRH